MTSSPALCLHQIALANDWAKMKGLHSFARGPLVLETLLWGFFSCLIVVSSFLWIWNSPHTIRRMLMILTCVVMYIMATAHWGTMLSLWTQRSLADEQLLMDNIRGLTASNSTTSCPSDALDILASNNTFWAGKVALPSCAPTAFLSISVILSDAIVLFRAYTIWSGKRAIQITSAMLLLALVGISGSNTIDTCIQATSSRCLFCGINMPGPSLTVCLSFVLNLWATSTVAYKAWLHKRVVKNYLTTGTTLTRSQKLLALFVDSGALYSALWAGLVVSEFSPIGSKAESVFSEYFLSTSLIQVVGMYPSMLLIAISMEKYVGSGPQAIRTVQVLTQSQTARFSVNLPIHHVQVVEECVDPAVSVPSVVDLHGSGSGRNSDVEAKADLGQASI
ncbi:hypothetical protein BC629DRAFT_1596065 [Irpex lacteus]|nr:hypothetical protein BC629DRAFT_1596065 [Irpex lacteus]